MDVIYGWENRINGIMISDVFYKGDSTGKVTKDSEQVHKPPAWAIDLVAYDKIVSRGVRKLVVIDSFHNLRYSCSIETFKRYKGFFNRKCGDQYFLTLNRWETEIPHPR